MSGLHFTFVLTIDYRMSRKKTSYIQKKNNVSYIDLKFKILRYLKFTLSAITKWLFCHNASILNIQPVPLRAIAMQLTLTPTEAFIWEADGSKFHVNVICWGEQSNGSLFGGRKLLMKDSFHSCRALISHEAKTQNISFLNWLAVTNEHWLADLSNLLFSFSNYDNDI